LIFFQINGVVVGDLTNGGAWGMIAGVGKEGLAIKSAKGKI
jgi:hypothetical protein